jgi:hypothetical protein
VIARLTVVLVGCGLATCTHAGTKGPKRRSCESFDSAAVTRVLETTGDPPKTHDPRVVEHLERFDRCGCEPDYPLDTTTFAPSDACGPFPCTANGCYVRPCTKDSDCEHGFCASHTGWPDDWCVESDDI